MMPSVTRVARRATKTPMDAFPQAPRPTHDEARDVGAAVGARYNYNLAPSRHGVRNVVKTNPHMRAGIGRARRVTNSMLPGIGEGPNCLVTARSGNQGWDEDVYQAVGGVEDESAPNIPCLGAEAHDPGIPLAKGLALGAFLVGAYLLWSSRRD